MAKGRQLKGRIRSVQNTRKITRTMELVSTSKLKRAQDRVVAELGPGATHFKVGDEVLVLAGKDKGKRGVISRRVDAEHVIVDGVNVAKKAVKPNPMTGVTGGIVDKAFDQVEAAGLVSRVARRGFNGRWHGRPGDQEGGRHHHRQSRRAAARRRSAHCQRVAERGAGLRNLGFRGLHPVSGGR